jgi:hypothetical protein
MPDYNTDGRHGLRALEGTSAVQEIDEGFAALRDDVDDIIATDDQGALASRPVSTVGTPGKAGRYYWATDDLALYRDHGTGWTKILTVDSNGKLHITGEIEIDGALNHDGTAVGFRGKPALSFGQPFTISGISTTKTLTTSSNLATVIQVVAALIEDLQNLGLIAE